MICETKFDNWNDALSGLKNLILVPRIDFSNNKFWLFRIILDICTLMKVVIKKATILCAQSQYHLQQKDILIVNGIIEKIAANIPVDKKLKVIEGKNLHASIGWMDVFADFADPGFEYKEDLR